MNGYLLDTHSWLWIQGGETERFSAASIRDIEARQARRELYVSAISILEIARLVSLNQYLLPCSVDDFVHQALGVAELQLLDLTPRILIDSTRLPGQIHRDPSDRLLVSTARHHGLTLITRDKSLLAYAKQGHLNARKP